MVTNTPELPDPYFQGSHTEVTEVEHNGHNGNGCSLDRRKCQLPDFRGVLCSSNIPELDEAYTRRVLGFLSAEEWYRWVSCIDLLNQIDDLPVLLVNSADDPCVLKETHKIAKDFVGM